MTINSIDSPIERRNGAMGNPGAISHFDAALSKRQTELLEKLPEFDSRIITPKKNVSMADLAALTAKTGHEFTMFTKGNERLIIRGNAVKVNINIQDAEELAGMGYRWSGHTHPGAGKNALIASTGDVDILKCFEQSRSVIYNATGDYRYFWKE